MELKLSRFLHGGDYNPEQWKDYPGIFEEDLRLMGLAGVNTASVGIFSWAELEPAEGVFEFDWLEKVVDGLWANGISIVLATPSGAKPAWMSAKYPEILRVGADRRRDLHGLRHNHCLSSPVYREKCAVMNAKLAERFGKHPGLILWHVSNEYGGECHCPLCQGAFRKWLGKKYGNDLGKLNHAWWNGFWSHTYTDWAQVESPSPIGESSSHGLALDWRRFVTDQTLDFFLNESAPLRKITPGVPVCINMMGLYPGLDYWKFAPHVDVVTWDNYPSWGSDALPAADLASNIGFVHDINRSLKGGLPFLMMESTPSLVNWQPVSKLKRPGMHAVSSLQAIAHGSDSVQYFQWRKGRGGFEKFHGAVVDHVGHEHTRVFAEVARVGELLSKAAPAAGSRVVAKAAVVYDWENRWAIDETAGLREKDRDYAGTCQAHYRSLWKQGIPADVVNQDADLSGYALVIAPMSYMLKDGFAERLSRFVESGGTLVSSYLSGYVDGNDLCFLGGFPGPLRKTLGIWIEEIDSLYDSDRNSVVPLPGSGGGKAVAGLGSEYRAFHYCELVNPEGARVHAVYGSDWYADRAALTSNAYGKGRAWHIAARTGQDFLDDFYRGLCGEIALYGVLGASGILSAGVEAQARTGPGGDFVFLLNYEGESRLVGLGDAAYRNLVTGSEVRGTLELLPFEVAVLLALP